MTLSKSDKIILAYLGAGVLVRLAGYNISQRINTETFLATVVTWPVALVKGYSGVTVLPPVYNNQNNPSPQNAPNTAAAIVVTG
jgi:hypothetical protein